MSADDQFLKMPPAAQDDKAKASKAEAPEGSIEQKIKELQYVHVDDQPEILDTVGGDLKNDLGMDKRLGTAQSAEGMINVIKSLLDVGKRLDLILSDRSFYLYEDDDVAEDGAAEKKFLPALEGLANDPKYTEALKNVAVIMNSAMDPNDFQKLQKRFPRVIGWIPKNSEKSTAENLKSLITKRVEKK